MAAPVELTSAVFARWLRDTGLGEHADADSIYQAFTQRCGYDTIRKLLAAHTNATMPGCDPSATVLWMLDTGAGATCMAGAVALCAVLRAHGHDAGLIGCRLEAAAGALAAGAPQPDPDQPIGHLGVEVSDAGRRIWYDTAINHQRGLVIGGQAGVCDETTSGIVARVDCNGFHRASATTGAPLHFMFESRVDDTEHLAALIEHTRTTVDTTWPLYIVRGGENSWAARGGSGGIEQMELGASELTWEQAALDGVMCRAGVSGDIAAQVAAALE